MQYTEKLQIVEKIKYGIDKFLKNMYQKKGLES